MKLPALLTACCLFTVAVAGAKTGDDLSPQERAQLEKDGILIGAQEFRQSFEPYIENDVPVFITSDAVLHAFHILFEESLARVEAANVTKLESLLSRITGKLPAAVRETKGVPDIKAAAARRAEVMLKTALRLLGRAAPGSSPAVEKIIAAQVQEIEAATGTRKPEWLGPLDEGFMALDFTRYAPRGLYARSTVMQRYFRAVSWLQSVPFRVLVAEEYVAAQLIGRAAYLSQPTMSWAYLQREPFLESWAALAGERDDHSLMDLLNDGMGEEGMSFDNAADLKRMQEHRAEEMNKKRRQPRVNDTLRFPPGDPALTAPPEYRLLSAVALPDAVMMQRTSVLAGSGGQRYPDPLEVAAGLGSAFATDTLKAALPGEVWAGIAPGVQWLSARPSGPSLYDSWLGCMRELVNAPEPDAPDFLRGAAWQRKSCQTLLASWTQMRHALILQAKTHQFFAGPDEPPPGFVEPDPEFFRKLAELCAQCLAVFGEAGGFNDNTEAGIMDELYRAKEEADRVSKLDDPFVPFNQQTALNRLWTRLSDDFPLPEEPDYPERGDASDAQWEKMEQAHAKVMAAYHGRLRDAIGGVIRKLEAAPPAERTALLAKMHLMETTSFASRWQGLAHICSRAQSIAHRQLRKTPLTEEERGFIKDFGFALASAMFYDGNSYQAARDDAPRIADVFSGPEGHLHAATGRPRILYVHYPWEKGALLCVGAVLPFYGFKHGPERLTDDAWMHRLDTAPPVPPAWIKPVLQTKSAPPEKSR